MNGRRRIGWLVATVAIAAVSTLAASAGELGRCETAQVHGPLVLPDGKLHDAQSIQVCFNRAYSPAEGLHEISVDGQSIGLFRGREVPVEWTTEVEPYLLLERDADGRLELRGYATRRTLHDLAPGEPSVSASWQLLSQR